MKAHSIARVETPQGTTIMSILTPMCTTTPPKKKRKNNMPFLALHVSHRFFSFITNVGAQVRLYGRRNVVFSFAHYSFFPPPLCRLPLFCAFFGRSHEFTFASTLFSLHRLTCAARSGCEMHSERNVCGTEGPNEQV